eukprot:scpid11509/ scgid2981/ Protein FAM73B
MPSLPEWLLTLGSYIPKSRTGRIVLIVTGSTLIVLSAAGLYIRRRRRKYIPPGAAEPLDYTRLRTTSVMSPYSHGAESVALSGFHSFGGDDHAGDRPQWQPASQIMSTEELCAAGLQAVQASIHYWHTAVTRLRNRTIPRDGSSSSDRDALATVQSLEALIDQTHRIEEMYQRRIRSLHPDLNQSDSDSFIAIVDTHEVTSVPSLNNSSPQFHDCFSPPRHETDCGRPVNLGDSNASNLLDVDQISHPAAPISETSSVDSFVSATMQLDSPAELSGQGMDLTFYNEGMEAAQAGNVPFRSIRTGMLSCLSDNDFLAKLFCVRRAFENILRNKSSRDWIITSGCQLVSLFLQAAGKEAQAFVAEYKAMIAYVESTSTEEMFGELKERRLAYFSFYDVVLDFALMDAFADLENPPSTITSVLNNRWLTDGFKETALNTAVWSMLKAKRSMVQANGFMHHFYNVMSTLSPILAWGFLGPSRSLQGQCAVFKDQLLHLMSDIFSLTTVRYSTVEALSEDILDSTKVTFQQLVEHFQATMAHQ